MRGSGRMSGAIGAMVVLALVAAACSDDDDSSDAGSTTSVESEASGSDGTTSVATTAVTTAPESDTTAATSEDTSASQTQVGELPPDALEVMSRPPFSGAHWVLEVAEADSGEVVLALNPDELAPIASAVKLFWVGAALNAIGPDTTLTTPVYAVGDDLVLVASGDLVLGSRNAGSGELGYGLPPQPDANAIPGAQPAPGDPLGGLNDLAAQVAASGVSEVAGDVLIDDRLFDTWETPAGPVTPMVVNDNLVAVLTTPAAAAGDPAAVRAIPETDAFVIVNEVTTVAAGDGTSIDIEPGVGNELVVSGTVEAGSDEVLNVFDVPDPAAYARTLFIEALERAGVTVAADPLQASASDSLPDADAYGSDNRVAELESPPYREQAELIWKISHNLGARMALCLLAVEIGSTDCIDGYEYIDGEFDDLGIEQTDVWFPPDNEAATPAALTTWLGWLGDTIGYDQLSTMLPIYGVDGSLGLSGQDSPARGLIQAKTGTSATLDLSNGRLLIRGKILAGFIEAEDGTLYRFAVQVSNASYDGLQDQIRASDDLADFAVAIQQSL